MDTRLNAVHIYIQRKSFHPSTPVYGRGTSHFHKPVLNQIQWSCFSCDNEARNVLRHEQKQEKK